MSTPKYYILVTSKDDFSIDIQNELNVIGLPHSKRATAQKLQIGDRLVFYISKLGAFGGIAEVTSDYYYSKEKIWSDEYDLWPHRVRSKSIFHFKNITKVISIKSIWDNITFIKNKHKWGCYFQGSLRSITKEDYQVIHDAFSKTIE